MSTVPKGYFVDEAKAEAFDKGFPYKENWYCRGKFSKRMLAKS